MRRLALFSAVLTIGLMSPLRAQEWSSEERAVLDQLEECWNIWMEGVESGSPERWIADCTAPYATFWPGNDGAPFGHEFIRRTWNTISGRDLGWTDIRPVLLKVEGDIAVLHFYGYWRAPSGDGEVVTEARRTEVFQKIDGRWKIIVGHGTPVTPADADPYRRGDA